ncbi:DivIVA domain-containing protein [Nocardia abscessus]|uniref:DivIVA domain-containing protein n=1 Tax=Nocardia abscessus TaxID=120957 RepID=UPI0018941A2D|nr:DivIVA domain-containing protein [Nocardia abscessus]MBF6340657.1 DivIVA domain-containing protein [Nocardia abscessus]
MRSGGYDKDEVDAFIDVVGEDLKRVTDENLDLKVALRKPDLMIAELQSQLASKRVPVSVELQVGSPVAHHRGVAASAHRPRLAAPGLRRSDSTTVAC